MDYEKKYKEAMKACKELSDSFDNETLTEELEKIFPELAKSEDERIRTTLICELSKIKGGWQNGLKVDDVLAWLEKQGEQKSIISDDALREGKDYFGITQHQIDNWLKKYVHVEKQGEQKPNYCHHEVDLSNCSEEYTKGYYDGWNNCNQQHAQLEAEQKPVDVRTTGYWHVEDTEQEPAWSEEDERIFVSIIEDVMPCGECPDYPTNEEREYFYEGNRKVDWLKSLKDRVQLQHEWKQENTDDLTDFENAMMHIGGSFFGQYAGLDPNDTNAIKEQANALLEFVPRQEWSEEGKKLWVHDDDIFLDAIKMIVEDSPRKSYGGVHKKEIVPWFYSLKERLKSIKDRYTWKPSDEQMVALDGICSYIRNKADWEISQDMASDLYKLSEQLKKLMEE